MKRTPMKRMTIEQYREWQKRSKGLARKSRMRKRAKPGSLSAAKEATWKAFSLYIRTRDCLATTGIPDRGVCCTCGRVYEFRALHAGHFIPQRRNANLFDERGVHAQCYGCNCMGSGQGAAYEEYMLEHYGQDVIDELRTQNLERRKFTVEELNQMTVDFTTRRMKLKPKR